MQETERSSDKNEDGGRSTQGRTDTEQQHNAEIDITAKVTRDRNRDKFTDKIDKSISKDRGTDMTDRDKLS